MTKRKNLQLEVREVVLEFWWKHGPKKTKRKFNLTGPQIKRYRETLDKQRKILAEAKKKDEKITEERNLPTPCTSTLRKANIRGSVQTSSGFERAEEYVWCHNQMLTWFTEMRGQKFIVTPRVLKIYCQVKLAVAGRPALTDEEYWYRSFNP